MIDITKPLEISFAGGPWMQAVLACKNIAVDFNGVQSVMVTYDHETRGASDVVVHLERQKHDRWAVRNVPNIVKGWVNVYKPTVHPTEELAVAARIQDGKWLGCVYVELPQ